MAVMLAAGLVISCDDGNNGNNGNNGSVTPSNESTLRTLKVNGITADLGTPSLEGWNKVTIGEINLSNSKKTDAPLVATPANANARVEYAQVKFNATNKIPGAYAVADKMTFDDGDKLYVRVTSASGNSIRYYGMNVYIGRDATLKSVLVGSASADLGTSKLNNWGTFNAAQLGTCQAEEKMPAAGFTVTITANDEEAKVYCTDMETSVTTAPTFTAYDPENPPVYVFPDPPYLKDVAVKVISGNEKVTRYYRIRFITKSYAYIYKGTPSLTNPSDANDKQYIDPIWNDATKFTDEGEGDMKGWLDISRINRAESFQEWFATDYGKHTTAKAKVLWDDDGIWVYCDGTFTDYKESESGSSKTRTASRSGTAATYKAGTETDLTNMSFATPDQAHTRDSLELFINERLQAFKSGNFGEQYRVGLPNEDGTIYLSGEKPIGTPNNLSPPPYNTVVKFQMDNKAKSWVKMEGGKQTGFVIIMWARWVNFGVETVEKVGTTENPYFGKDPDDKVFGADGKIIEGAEIGLELQINACSAVGTRDGILTWNGVTSQAYQNVKSFGIVQLKSSK